VPKLLTDAAVKLLVLDYLAVGEAVKELGDGVGLLLLDKALQFPQAGCGGVYGGGG